MELFASITQMHFACLFCRGTMHRALPREPDTTGVGTMHRAPIPWKQERSLVQIEMVRAYILPYPH